MLIHSHCVFRCPLAVGNRTVLQSPEIKRRLEFNYTSIYFFLLSFPPTLPLFPFFIFYPPLLFSNMSGDAQSFLSWYLSQLAANPLRTKACTSGVLSGTQELCAQKLSGQKNIDKRIIQMLLYGLCISGPLSHCLYEIMNKVFAGKTGPKVKLGQLLFSNLIISPIMNSGK